MAIDILVTEDESIVRKDIERCLNKLGYNVVATADNGDKASATLALPLQTQQRVCVKENDDLRIQKRTAEGRHRKA